MVIAGFHPSTAGMEIYGHIQRVFCLVDGCHHKSPFQFTYITVKFDVYIYIFIYIYITFKKWMDLDYVLKTMCILWYLGRSVFSFFVFS